MQINRQCMTMGLWHAQVGDDHSSASLFSASNGSMGSVAPFAHVCVTSAQNDRYSKRMTARSTALRCPGHIVTSRSDKVPTAEGGRVLCAQAMNLYFGATTAGAPAADVRSRRQARRGRCDRGRLTCISQARLVRLFDASAFDLHRHQETPFVCHSLALKRVQGAEKHGLAETVQLYAT
jgi:hypothetical protein